MLLLLPPLPGGLGLGLLCLSRAAALGFNQSLWVYAAELLPTAVRASGIGVVTCFARLAGIVAANTLTGLWHVSHAATLGICSAGCLLAAVLVQRGLPRDTAGASLRDTVGEPKLFVAQSDALSWEGPPLDGAGEVADSSSQGAAATQVPASPPALSEQQIRHEDVN